MERIEYDPEIDPSIREEREAAEREMELTARIRLEIERYVEENDLVPREQAAADVTEEQESGTDGKADGGNKQQDAEEKAGKEDKRQKREEKRAQRTARATRRRKAIGSVFTGSILSSDLLRTMWPYLLVFALLLVGYIAQTFQLQKLNLERQALEREVRELGVEAISRTAERVRGTSRSAIVDKLAEKEIPLKEFPHPVKKIER